MKTKLEPAGVLLADPPWPFKDRLPGGGRGAAKHYKVMPVHEIARFELPPLRDDSALVLWRVGAFLEEALFVMRAWGFRFTGGEIVWVKTTKNGEDVRRGMGRTVRNAHEIAMIGYRGRPKRLSGSVGSVVFAPLGEHSEKPDVAYEAVENLYGGPYVELFARRERKGWSCFGDELVTP